MSSRQEQQGEYKYPENLLKDRKITFISNIGGYSYYLVVISDSGGIEFYIDKINCYSEIKGFCRIVDGRLRDSSLESAPNKLDFETAFELAKKYLALM